MIENEIQIIVPKAILEKGQEIVNIMAAFFKIPAALIMRLNDPHIEVLVSSHCEGNPYHPGDKENVWGSGLYCEAVINSQNKLLVPNFRHSPTDPPHLFCLMKDIHQFLIE